MSYTTTLGQPAGLATNFFYDYFIGTDSDGNGQLTGDERGILPQFFDWCAQEGSSIFNGLISALDPIIPDIGPIQPEMLLKQCFYIANLWLPLDYLILQITVWYAAYVVAKTIRLTMAFIPFVG